MFVDPGYSYITDSQMEKLRKKCREELNCATDPKYLIGCIYELFQDYIISEDQEVELYFIVDPEEKWNSCREYYEAIEDNALKECLGYGT